MALPLLACIKPGSGIGSQKRSWLTYSTDFDFSPIDPVLLINPVLDLRSQLTVVGQAIGLST
jgi:hypothetical protein